jgi:hypothetical protein
MIRVVETRQGKVRGSVSDGVVAFKGIPYAASPFGANRLLPPQPVEPWSGVRDTLTFGPNGPQVSPRRQPPPRQTPERGDGRPLRADHPRMRHMRGRGFLAELLPPDDSRGAHASFSAPRRRGASHCLGGKTLARRGACRPLLRRHRDSATLCRAAESFRGNALARCRRSGRWSHRRCDRELGGHAKRECNRRDWRA